MPGPEGQPAGLHCAAVAGRRVGPGRRRGQRPVLTGTWCSPARGTHRHVHGGKGGEGCVLRREGFPAKGTQPDDARSARAPSTSPHAGGAAAASSDLRSVGPGLSANKSVPGLSANKPAHRRGWRRAVPAPEGAASRAEPQRRVPGELNGSEDRTLVLWYSHYVSLK